MHYLTHAFATALTQARAARFDDDYEPVADTIAELVTDFGDERKADLYALIQEAVTPTMPFAAMTEALDRCLTANERHFTRG